MPFDFQGIVIPPTLAGLAFALRHKELWPADFKWNFAGTMRCAMGLATKLFGISRSIEIVCSMPSRNAVEIFIDCNGKRPEDITPEEIADRIEKYLAGEA